VTADPLDELRERVAAARAAAEDRKSVV